jgi:hypothetical protein
MRHPRPMVLAGAALGIGLSLTASAAGATNTWATQAVQAGPAAATDEAVGYAVAPLADGSSLVAGYFEGAATFGATTLTSARPGEDEAFVAKLNADGSWAWATQAVQEATAAGGDAIRGITALPDGSAIVTGSFKGDTTFGTTTLTSGGTADNIFVAKISPGGAWAWATAVSDTGSQPDVGRAVSALADGSAIVSGYVRGTPTFAPLAPFTTSRRDAFVAKISPSGVWQWVSVASGATDDEAFGVSALGDGSAVVAGRFTGTATFAGVGTLTSAAGTDAFVAKVNPAGTWQWATRGGGSGDDVAFATSAFADGSAVSTGSFEGTAAFGSQSLTAAAGGAFVGRTSPTGEWQWATKAEDTVAATGVAIAARPDGAAMFGGSIQGTAVFGGTTLVTGAARDAVIAQISPSGAWEWAQQAGDGAFAEGRGIAVFPDRSFVMVGDFATSLRFGANALTSNGTSDVFAARFAEAPDAPTGLSGNAGYERASFTWTAPAVNGGTPVTSYRVTASPGGGTCTATAPALSCTVTGLTNGTGYRARVVAITSAGTSPVSAESAVVTPLPTAFRVTRTSVLKTPVTRRAVAIRTSVRVDGAGVIGQTSTRIRAGKLLIACTTKPRTTSRATTAVVSCVLNRATRNALRTTSQRVRVITTFTPAGESAQSETITVRIPRDPVRRLPVTG